MEIRSYDFVTLAHRPALTYAHLHIHTRVTAAQGVTGMILEAHPLKNTWLVFYYDVNVDALRNEMYNFNFYTIRINVIRTRVDQKEQI